MNYHYSDIINTLCLPTPLQPTRNPALFIKRDDLLGRGLGGQKLRKLAYILSRARHDGITALVTTGRTNSSNVCLTGVMGIIHGFRVAVVLLAADQEDRPLTLNERILRRLGISIDMLVDSPVNRPNLAAMFAEQVSRLTARLEAEGERVLFIPNGGCCFEGTLALADAFDELHLQMCALGHQQYTIALPVGTGSTFAGLWCGIQRAGADVALRGYSIARSNPRCKEETIKAAQPVCAHFGLPVPTPDELSITDRFLGDGYSCLTDWSENGVAQALRSEGILMDHTYSGKAYGALLAELEHGEMAGHPVVFWHTGGVTGGIDLLLTNDQIGRCSSIAPAGSDK